MSDLGLLLLRVVSGGLLAGHGAQKLFGWFGGHGPGGTARFLESIGVKPGHRWAFAAGASEFGSGLLTALGFLWPIGPITELAPMAMAMGTVHWGKPIWATAGGGELPVINMATAVSLAMTGPGRLSLDRLLGVRMRWPLTALAAAGVVGGVALGLYTRRSRQAEAEGAQPAVGSQEAEASAAEQSSAWRESP
jgi:putative oxidoreductase